MSNEENKFGSIEISSKALTVIASIATLEIGGVSRLQGSFTEDTLEKFGKKAYSKGVKLEFCDKELVIDIYCTLKFGVSVSKVSKNIQENVRNSIYNMTEIQTKSINVNVLGIDF